MTRLRSSNYDPFINPVWSALHGTHRHFAMHAGAAYKYPAEVAPFAAIATNDEETLRQLHSLLTDGESVSLIGDIPPAIEGIKLEGSLAGVQMVAPQGWAPDIPSDVEIHQLTEADALAMVELTSIAFPGYFRKRTCEMGSYYGVRQGGALIAMAGERIAFDQNREISGVCTHPAHTGKGYAARLVSQLMHNHGRSGRRSFLHTAAENHRAIALYERLGFSLLREVTFHRIRRTN